MKRKFCLILALVFLLVTIPLPVMAANPTLSVSSVEGKLGETVNVELSIEGNLGLSYLGVKVGYDQSQLTLKSVTNNQLIGGWFQEGPLTKNPITLLWANADKVADGTLATLSFEIREDATLTSTPVTVTVVEAYDLSNEMNDVPIFTNDGNVGIHVPTTGVAMDRDNMTIDLVNGTDTLVATVTPSNATNKNVIWSSDNPEVADVSDEGVITAYSKGTAKILVATEDGGYEYECIVTVVCSHTGGTATCEELKVCEKCNDSYGEFEAHTLTVHNRVEPDHFNTGSSTYYTCDVCEKIFADANGEIEVSENDTVLDVIPHEHATSWSYDETYHWRECSCGDKADYSEHVYDYNCDSACNTCGYVRVVEHTWNQEYSSNETSHWFECGVCGEKKNVTTHKCDTEIVGEKYYCSPGVYYHSCKICGGLGTTTFELFGDNGKISVLKVNGIVGKDVSVSISIDENPGIVNMLLHVKYDTSVLKLKSVSDSGLLGGETHSDAIGAVPYTLCWANDTRTENITATGTIATLTFEVLEGAELGTSVIEVYYDYGDAEIMDLDCNLIGFEITNGAVEVSDVLIGDVNSDGKVNTLDRVLLARYIANWEGYTEEDIDLVAADVNCDGKVNTLDRVILARYIANWEGYTELPYEN